MTQAQSPASREWAAQQTTAYPIDLIGKLRTNLKQGKFKSDEKVIYVRKSVLLAIQRASKELNKAQEEFAAHVVDAEGAASHGAGEVVLEKMAHSSPWGAFSLMDKLVDEDERGRERGSDKMGSSRGQVDKGDWMTQLKQKKKEQQAELESAAAAAAAKAAATAAAVAAQAEEQARKRAAVATIWSNWLAYKAKRDQRRALPGDPGPLGSPPGDESRADSAAGPQPHAAQGEGEGGNRGGNGEGSDPEFDDEEDDQGLKWRKSAATNFRRSPPKKHKPVAPGHAPKEGAAAPRRAMFQQAEEEAEGAEEVKAKKGRRKKKKQAVAAAGAEAEEREDAGSDEEDEEYSERRVEEAFESAAHLMAIADKICEGSGEGEGEGSKVNSPRAPMSPRGLPEYVEEGEEREGLAAAGRKGRRRSEHAEGGWSGSGSGEEEEEEGSAGGQQQGEEKQKLKSKRKGRRGLHREESRAAQTPETPTAGTRVGKSIFAVPSDLLGAQGDMVFSRYGWVLRSEMAGPMRPIDPAIMILLKRVMAEALRARKVGEVRQAMRLVTRATTLLQACLKPLVMFSPEDALVADPSVPLAVKQYAPGPDARRSGVPWWLVHQSFEEGEELGRVSYPSRAVGGCATAMPTRMLCAMHRHQRAVLVPLMPPSVAVGPPTAQLQEHTPLEASGSRARQLPRVQGHNPGPPRHPSPKKAPPPGPNQAHSALSQSSAPLPGAAAAAAPQDPISRFLPPSAPHALALAHASSWSPWLQNGKSQALVPRGDAQPRATASHDGEDNSSTNNGDSSSNRRSPSPHPPATPSSHLMHNSSQGGAKLPPAAQSIDIRPGPHTDGELSQLLGALRPVSVSSSWSVATPGRMRNVANVERMASRAGRVRSSCSSTNLALSMREVQGSPQRLRRLSRTIQMLPPGLQPPSPPHLVSGLGADIRVSPAKAKSVVRLPSIPAQI